MQDDNANQEPWASPIPLRQLRARDATPVVLTPDAATRAALAQALGILGIRKLRLEGVLQPSGRRDWLFTGTLGATVDQACVVTLEPVRSRIEEKVRRLFLAEWHDPEGGTETEMPEEDEAEPLGSQIDPGRIMAEALALALPPYPRAEGVAPVEASLAPPGAAPLTDEDVSPFTALRGLREKLQDKGD